MVLPWYQYCRYPAGAAGDAGALLIYRWASEGANITFLLEKKLQRRPGGYPWRQ